MDSNHRSLRQRIYSPLPLAAREPIHDFFRIGYSLFKENSGAGDGTRTRNLLITNQLLCQLSYTSQQVWCLRVDLNHRHRDFQSLALPAELPRQEKMATRRGLEPLTSSVTGWRTNQLYYRAIISKLPIGISNRGWWAFRDSNPGPTGYEPVALTN